MFNLITYHIEGIYVYIKTVRDISPFDIANLTDELEELILYLEGDYIFTSSDIEYLASYGELAVIY